MKANTINCKEIGGVCLEKKPMYYDGSGYGEKLIQSEILMKQLMINKKLRKNLGGNPYVIDWNQLKKTVK